MAPINPISEPFPIYLASNRYLIFDADVVAHIRAKHHMVGFLIGTLGLAPQQNVFTGLPMQLMDEEASLLVEKGAAYIVDDKEAHKIGLREMLEADKKAYVESIEREQNEKTGAKRRAALELTNAHLNKLGRPGIVEKTAEPEAAPEADDALFASSSPAPSIAPDHSKIYTIHTTSDASYHRPSPSSVIPRPNPASYALFKYLQANGYYMMAGMRFGCQFVAYPGDPLRFHSHFICTGVGWEDEVPMIDIVSGGRLGTGVKKAWFVGGEVEDEEGEGTGEVRAFSVEWAGF